MKAIIITILITLVGGFAAWFSKSSDDQPIPEISPAVETTNARRPVLVELFTSEGCSSCPPADRVLTVLQNDQLIPDAEVITLAFHVDYWDYLGWKDRFSSAAFSQRQAAYARQFKLDSSYTPQMVVDGAFEFVGSNRANANKNIAASAAKPKAAVDLGLKANKLTANVSGLASHAGATLYLAVAESKLSTRVRGGENSGSTLEHTSVVRDLLPIGIIKSGENKISVEREVSANKDWKSENIKYVVFVQENSTMKVLAVNQIGR